MQSHACHFQFNLNFKHFLKFECLSFLLGYMKTMTKHMISPVIVLKDISFYKYPTLHLISVKINYFNCEVLFLLTHLSG